MTLNNDQMNVAVDWWTEQVAYMYALEQSHLAQFRSAFVAQLAENQPASIDVRTEIPEILRAPLETVGIGENARYRLRAHMCFPGNGVVVCDGRNPYPEPASVKKQRQLSSVPVFERSIVDQWPATLLLPFSGLAIWEQSAWYCGRTYRDKQSGDEKKHDKVWAACLLALCAEEETISGVQPCLKWEYRVRYGPRQGAIKQEVMPFEAVGQESAQQRAAGHYRRKVREQSKEYEAILFDDPYYKVQSFNAFLTSAMFAV